MGYTIRYGSDVPERLAGKHSRFGLIGAVVVILVCAISFGFSVLVKSLYNIFLLRTSVFETKILMQHSSPPVQKAHKNYNHPAVPKHPWKGRDFPPTTAAAAQR